MKKWICTVCGYIHEGPEPPDECPVCGADKSMFEEVKDEASEAAPAADAPAPAAPEAAAASESTSARKWECTVCGYIHEGPEPPEECPVCGADRSAFVEVTEDAPAETGAAPPAAAAAEPAADGSGESPKADAPRAHPPNARPDPRAYDLGEPPADLPGRLYRGLLDQMLKHHAHPVSVHVPNGVIPFAFLFILLFLATGWKPLETAAFVNMIFVVLTLPFVLFSGYIEWQKRYRGFPGNRFIQKIIYASIVTSSAIFSVVWWLIDPDVLSSGSSERWAFVLLHVIMLGAAIMAGLIGGKFIFRD
jgi:rubredoxin/uncharacterized membrane protein